MDGNNMNNMNSFKEIFPEMVKIATSGMSDTAKSMNKNIKWDGKEFDSFASALEFVKDNEFVAINFFQYKDKICIFFAKGGN